MPPRGFAHISAQALVPEHIAAYVSAVGESRPVMCGGCVAYDYEGRRTLIAYAPGSSPDEDEAAREAVMNAAVDAALADPSCRSLTVLGPARPAAAPENAAFREDAYAFLSLPFENPGQNLRNMLRRGARECLVREESWGEEHAALVREYIASRPLEAGTRHIYRRIPEYLAAVPDAALFAARAKDDPRLLAFAIGDFSGLTTAFYMFAFRKKTCPPGVSDLLLHALAQEGAHRGHTLLNLGLGVNEGIAAFKRKWAPAFFLPCAQTTWNPREQTAKRAGSPAKNDPLSVFAPSGFAQNVRRFLLGEKRPFDCLQIEVTSQCPGKCSYCPHTTKRGAWRSRRMEDATFAALHPLITRAKRAHLQGWGEPLLHPRFFDYATAALRAGCAVSTTTCGFGITPAVAAKLAASGIDIAAFSLAGTDEASNASRAGVPFAQTASAIRELARAKKIAGSLLPHIHIAYLMLASQAERVSELPDLMAELEAPTAVVSTLDYIAAPDMAKEAYSPHETEKIEHARHLLQGAAERAASMGMTIHYSLPGPAGRNECNERIQSCMYIDAEGAVAPCIYVNLPTNEKDPCRRVFGSVREKNPMDIWTDLDYALFRKRLASGDPDLPCRTCAKRFERLH